MPITRNSDDYLDIIQQDILDHYHITLPKAAIKIVPDQFQQSIHHHLKQANQIDLSPFITIYPSLPLIRSLKAKYYNTTTNTSPAIKHLLKVARQTRKQSQASPYTSEKVMSPSLHTSTSSKTKPQPAAFAQKSFPFYLILKLNIDFSYCECRGRSGGVV